MIESVIVLGGYVNALGVVRQVHQLGLAVSVVTTKSSNLACYSRYVNKHYYYTDAELEQILKRHANKNTLLYPTGDEHIEFIDKNRDWVLEAYSVLIPSADVIRLFAEKINTYQFAERQAILHPKSYYFNSEGQIENASNIIFPVILKPSVMYEFKARFDKKAFVCRSEKELADYCQMIVSKGYSLQKMLMQEFLTGGPENLYSVGVFAINGEIKRCLQVNRLRQRPMLLGNSTTYCKSSEIQQLYDYAARIIRLSNYSGVAEIEFMFHKGEYKFLEVNMRSWKWHSISDGYGFSFVGECINYLNGIQSVPLQKAVNVVWVERLTDFMTSIPEILHGRMRLSDFLKSYHCKKQYAIWSWKDMLPAIVYPLQMAKNLLNKMIRR